MLTPKQLQNVVETMQPLLDDLNTWITKDIIKRVMARLGRGEGLEFTSTDVWQGQVLRDLGGHYEALQQELMAFTEAAVDEIRQIFQYSGLTAYNADAELYRQGGLDVPPLRQSPRILQLLEDTYRRTNGELRNYTRTTATASQQRLIQALDKAHIMVMAGATDYATAVREVVNELAEHQAFVRYPTGHIDTLEVAVLRAVRTGTAQASGNMSIGTMEQYGWDIVLTSAHLGARYGDGGENPGNHFWWQGRFFSKSGKDPRFPPFIESTGYGTGDGLCGWNCRHSFGPGDGVHNPWTQYDAKENKEAYDLSQRQRKKERDIRSQTKKVEALKTAVEAAQSDEVRNAIKETLKEEQGKLTALRKDYGSFCDENGLKRQAFRLQVAKAQQQQAVRAYHDGSTVNTASGIQAQESTTGTSSAAPASRLYLDKNDQLYKNLQNVKPIEGYEDFGSHGNPNTLDIKTNTGEWQQYNAEEFADILRADPEYHGGDIRLLVCNAGTLEDGFASQLAAHLGVRVMAPSEALWTSDKSDRIGDLFVSDIESLANLWYDGIAVKQSGHWRLFFPDGTWRIVDENGR